MTTLKISTNSMCNFPSLILIGFFSSSLSDSLAHLCPILILVVCNSCTEGMMRCLGRDVNQCCSWFLNDKCVQFCPAPLVGNAETFDCGEFALHLYISFIY